MALVHRLLLALPKPLVAVWYVTCNSLPLLVVGTRSTDVHEHQTSVVATPGGPSLLAIGAFPSSPTGTESFITHSDVSMSIASAKKTLAATQQNVQDKPIEAANITMKYDGIDPDSLVHHNGKTVTSDWRKERDKPVKASKVSNVSAVKSGSVLLRPAVDAMSTLAIMTTILGRV
mmetsp:Transcript_109227/g.216919  ORF Transcript_109227/g.216919 Transcript_109227/m.216919 type:complete len:175 (-) Transcript_109227:18-542(-)